MIRSWISKGRARRRGFEGVAGAGGVEHSGVDMGAR